MELNPEERELQVQLLYARWLDAATRIAFAISAAAFLVYAAGLLPAHVPLDLLPQVWGLPVDEFLRRIGAPAGWDWVGMMDRAEYLNLACVALIASVTLVCYLRVLPALVGMRQGLDAAVAALQIAVLLVAMSGFFAGGS
jgi:hypothetical protein